MIVLLFLIVNNVEYDALISATWPICMIGENYACMSLYFHIYIKGRPVTSNVTDVMGKRSHGSTLYPSSTTWRSSWMWGVLSVLSLTSGGPGPE